MASWLFSKNYWTVSMQWWMHKYQLKLFCPTENFLLILSICVSHFSGSTQKLQWIDIWYDDIWKTLFFTLWVAPRHHFAPRGVFCWFRPHSSYIFLKVHNIYIQYPELCLYLETLSFRPMKEPPRGGETFFHQGPMHSCSLAVSLSFFTYLGLGNIWAKFHGLSQLARFLC